MKTKSRKFPLPLWERVRVRGGITAVPLIIALVFMISLGTFFNSLILGKHIGAPLLAKTTGALYITEAGIEYTDDYLLGYDDWTTVTDIPSTSFGGGTFAVAFTNKTQDTVTAIATGIVGNAERRISINFERSTIFGSNPVSYLNGYTDQGTTILCEDGTPCGQPPATCSCSRLATSEEAPPPIPPLPPEAPLPPWPDYSGGNAISADCTFPEGCGITADPSGVYYFDNLVINQGVNITISGPVTIWILVGFEMKQSSTFNYLGDPADVLLLSASDGASFVLYEGAIFTGGIYAPNGTIELKNGAEVVGAVVGNDVILRNNSTVTFDPDAGGELIAAGSPPPETVIVASGWGEI